MTSAAAIALPLVLLAIEATTAPADADPVTPEAFADCKARVRALTAEAMKITDAQERGERLLAMPKCEREPDGTFEVIEPPGAPPVETAPFEPHFVFAVHAGLATSVLVSGVLQASGIGPSVELESDYRLLRRLSIGVSAGYTNFHDGAVSDPDGGPSLDVREQSFDAVAVAHAHYAHLFFGGGLGLDYERYGTGYTTTVPLLEIQAGYTFAAARRVRAQIVFSVTDAFTTYGFSGSSDSSDDLVCARVAVGIEL